MLREDFILVLFFYLFHFIVDLCFLEPMHAHYGYTLKLGWVGHINVQFTQFETDLMVECFNFFWHEVIKLIMHSRTYQKMVNCYFW